MSTTTTAPKSRSAAAIERRLKELEANRLFQEEENMAAAPAPATTPAESNPNLEKGKEFFHKVGAAAMHGGEVGGATAFVETLCEGVLKMIDPESLTYSVLNTPAGRRFLEVVLPILLGLLATFMPNLFPSFIPATLVEKVSLLAIEGVSARIVAPILMKLAATMRKAVTAAMANGMEVKGLSPADTATANSWMDEVAREKREEEMIERAVAKAAQAQAAAAAAASAAPSPTSKS